MPKFFPLSKSLLLASMFVLAFTPPALSNEPDPTSEFEKGAVYLEADELFKDENGERYVARGDVEARYQNRILRADEVIYFPKRKKVHARGSVVVIEADGTVEFADEVELNDELATGVALGFYARLPNNGKIGAAHAIHSKDGKVNRLKKVFYTACDTCENEDGSPTKPTWRIRASQAEQNQGDNMIYYRNAVFEIKGVPVLYSPYFAHADPTGGRRSGLLFPNIGQSERYGFFYEQPYYKVLSPSSDLTITPRVFTKVRPFIDTDYRKQFYSGAVRVRGGITHEQEFNGSGTRFGNDQIRGYVLGQGKFRLNPNWYWGFGAEAVTDDLLFQRYDIAFQNETRGLFRNSSNRLSNQVFLVGQGDDYYASIAGIRYQGLRANDFTDQLPIAAPLINATKIISDDVLGGKLAIGINTAVLNRVDGIDSRRATTSLDWNHRLVSKAGIIAKPYAQVRADYYNIENDNFFADLGTRNQNIGRVLGVVGTEISWPWLKAGKNVNWIVEPIAHFAASPEGDGIGTFDTISIDALGNTVRTPTSILPNEDSLATSFDETNLFRSSRVAGHDLWEDGVRASIGGRVSARWGQQGFATFTAGRIFRSTTNTVFSPETSLAARSSDYVAGLNVSTGSSLKVSSHIQLDKNSFDIRRFDVAASTKLTKAQLGPLRNFLHSARANIRYSNTPNTTASSIAIDELRVTGQAFVSKHWGISIGSTFDFERDQNRNTSIGLIYDDNCSRFELIFQRDNTVDRTLSSGDSIRFQFTLLTLGSFGN